MRQYTESPFSQPIHESVEKAVRDYTDRIVQAVKVENPLIEVDVDLDACLNTSETHQANSALITTEFGMVTVFPDFNLGSARAAVVCLGAINQMAKEGFSEEQIEEEGQDLRPAHPPVR
jgi:hypothetical protein